MTPFDESTISGKTIVRDPLDPMVGRLLAKRFRIEERIAAGGFGAIYRATSSNGRPVAIKILHPEWTGNPDVIARFRREGATLTNLRHPNTVNTLEVGEGQDGTLYIVMELLRGESLYTRFKERGALNYLDVAAIARQICASLGEAHALGIVHRDLKPANIHLVPRTGGGELVKVLDFGIAKIMRGSNLDDGTELTNVGQMIGTFDYMSPEQVMGGLCRATSDIYTLGVIMYEMISGFRPFHEVPGPAMVASLLTSDPPTLASRCPDLPPELDRIVMRCLQREQQDRYQTVAELANDLAQLAAAADGATQATRVYTTPRPELVEKHPRIARGSEPSMPGGDFVPTVALGPPGGVWRTVPAQPPIPPYVAPNSYVPPAQALAVVSLPNPPSRGSSPLPTYSLNTSTNAWVGQLVWVLAILVAVGIFFFVKNVVL